jgi:hypothetical protein
MTAMATAASSLSRPGTDEFSPYYTPYVARVPDGDLLATLESQLGETLALLRAVGPERSLHRYAPGKWSMRDLVQHLSDAERIFAYRALRIARGDETPLPGWDENRYAPAANADRRSWPDLIAELAAVRAATLALFRGLDADAFARRGIANGQPVTVRALVWIIAGHERHHVAVLRERYLPS